MSSLFLFSSSSGIPLIFFTTLGNSESLGYSFVGTLNGSFVYSNFKANLSLMSCGNSLIDAHWSTFHGLNLVHVYNRRTQIPISTYFMNIFETLFRLFSPEIFCYLRNNHVDVFSKELRKYSFSLQYILSAGLTCHIINNEGLYLENTKESFENLFEWKELSDKLNTSFIFCIHEGKIVSYSDLWFKLPHSEKFTIISLVVSYLPHSYIDVPIYLQSLSPEPLRLISISFSASFQFIGLFASTSKLDHIVNILSVYKMSMLERVVSNSSPFSNSLMNEFSNDIIGYMVIDYSTRMYFVEYSSSANVTLSRLLILLFETFSEFSSANSIFLQSPILQSDFSLKTQEFFLKFENASTYFLKRRNAIISVASENKSTNYLKKVTEFLYDRLFSM